MSTTVEFNCRNSKCQYSNIHGKSIVCSKHLYDGHMYIKVFKDVAESMATLKLSC